MKHNSKSSWNLSTLLFISFAVMIPWALLGIGFTQGHINQPDLSMLFFGGATGLVISPIILLFNSEPSGGSLDSLLMVIVALVWLAVLFVPPILMKRRKVSQKAVRIMWALQFGFSFVQALSGMVMILGIAV